MLRLIIGHPEVETEVINNETVVNKRTNEQFSVSNSGFFVDVKRTRAPKKNGKNSQNCYC